jgi:hypothetical protein
MTGEAQDCCPTADLCRGRLGAPLLSKPAFEAPQSSSRFGSTRAPNAIDAMTNCRPNPLENLVAGFATEKVRQS